MKYYIRGRAYIFPLFGKREHDPASGIPCGVVVSAPSKKEAEAKGLKELEKTFSSLEIEIITVDRVTKNYPDSLD